MMVDKSARKTSRQQILEDVAGQQPSPIELPQLSEAWTTFADPSQKFGESLAQVGGEAVFVSSFDEIQQWLNQNDTYRDARQRCVVVHGIQGGNLDLDTIEDPHDLEKVDYAIVPGEIAVAENGAVWITDRQLKHRVILFLVQHLAIVVARSQIVSNLHEAYQRIGSIDGGFGCFISGPSKTADIEQSLVIGAHGARSLTVFVCSDDRGTMETQSH